MGERVVLFREPPSAVGALIHIRESLVVADREFVKKLYTQTDLRQCCDDVAEAVLPLIDRAFDQFR